MFGTQQGILNTSSGVLILGVSIKRGSNVCAIVFCLYAIVIICLKESNSLAPYLALLYSTPPSITAPTDRPREIQIAHVKFILCTCTTI